MPDSYIIGIIKKSISTLALSQKATTLKTSVSQLNWRRVSGEESFEIFIMRVDQKVCVSSFTLAKENSLIDEISLQNAKQGPRKFLLLNTLLDCAPLKLNLLLKLQAQGYLLVLG